MLDGEPEKDGCVTEFTGGVFIRSLRPGGKTREADYARGDGPDA